MTVYMVNLGIVYICSWFARIYGKKDLLKPTNYKPNILMVFFALTSLILVSGLRYRVGTDYDTYADIYTLSGMYNSISEIIGSENLKDKGFIILCWLLNHISHDPQIMFFRTAIITNVFIVKTLYDYSRPFELGIFLYICSFHYYASFNGVRQYLVSAIIFWSLRYLITGNWKRYFIIVLVSSTFHASALVMIPVYFLVRRKAWTSTTLVMTLIFSIGAILYNNVLRPVLVTFIKGTQYEHYEQWLLTRNNGINGIKIIVILLPLLIAYIYREKLRKLLPESDYIVNLCILNFLFAILATRDVLFARFNIYFGLYQLLLIPWFTRLFNKELNTLLHYLIIICYFLYSFSLLPFDSNVLPYRSIFLNP